MDRQGFIVKVLIICLASVISSVIPTSPNEMPTRLISVDYSPYPYTNDDSNSNSNRGSNDDTIAQDSIKIENRQLYDTVKHASGYDPDTKNNTRNDESDEKLNTSSVKIFIPPRKSAVIQAIPRKVRGPGSISTSTTTSLPFARPPSLQLGAKDYGTGEPTTTIVYATSIPTTSTRSYVHIRPVPLLSTQKYRSTVVESKQEKSSEPTDTSTKPVMDNFSDEQQLQEPKSQVNVVLENPNYKLESNSEQATTTPRSYETTPYHIEQRKRNLYKSVPYARIRTNEDIDEVSGYNRNTFVNPYPNHKWTNEDFVQRMPPPPPPSLPQFAYENHHNPQQGYYQPSTNQNLFARQYPPSDDYQDEMYRSIPTPSPIYVPHQQPIANILSQQQQQQQHQQRQQQQQQQQRQQYQPLTVRDFDLLLQLLVLRERRLHASQEPFSPPSDFILGSPQDSNYYYDTPKTSAAETQFYKNREPKYLDNSIPIPRNGQPPNTRLLPSNVREELLFRMLLLALHLQPQPQPQPQPKPMPMARNPPILQQQYMYFGSPSSSAALPPAPSSATAAFLGFRQRNGNPKNPVRSVQVLGEID